jgi:8-oxo-dGTP diphosphatase
MIRVAAGVAERDGRVFVCRRAFNTRHPGKWEFPGGKLEPGETPDAALRRELREELAVEIAVGSEIWVTEHRYGGLEPVELRFFSVSFAEEPRDERHFEEVRWQPLDRLRELDFLDADLELVAALASREVTAKLETTRATPREDKSRPAPASTSARSPAARRDR